MSSILYISYDGIMEPLGYSQVWNYLKRTSEKRNIYLISFEKEIDLKNKTIGQIKNVDQEKQPEQKIKKDENHQQSIVINSFADLLQVCVLKKEIKLLDKHNIKLNAIGNLDALPSKAQKELEGVIQKTKNNTKMTLTLALSYGSREEITKTIQEISLKVKKGLISPENIDEKLINNHLYTQDLPDVDLLIRTSGEQRISNFLLWQLAYAELYFTDVLWPDYTKNHLFEAILNYQNRERRFGKTSEQL